MRMHSYKQSSRKASKRYIAYIWLGLRYVSTRRRISTAYAMFIPQLELSIQNHAVGKNTHPLHLQRFRLPCFIERTQCRRYSLRRPVHDLPSRRVSQLCDAKPRSAMLNAPQSLHEKNVLKGPRGPWI